MALQRSALMVSIAISAALTIAFALPTAVKSQTPAEHLTAHPCAVAPNPSSIVEDPPVAPDPHNITLYAFQDGTRFCYKQSPTDPYREAPTIVARNFPDYFDITLINRLQPPGASSAMAHGMHMAANTPPPQGNPPCPVLDTGATPPPMSPTAQTWPTPNPAKTFPSSPFLTYLDHKRSVDPYFPHPGVTPPHQGDTNLHFHGLDTDPLEDNVFRSTIVAPNRTCKFHIPLYVNQAEGTYWYHTHMHHVAEVQVSGGLAGALVIVRPSSSSPHDASQPRYDGRVLIVKDLVPAGQTSEAVQKAHRAQQLAASHPVVTAPPAMAAPGPTATPAPAGAPTPVPNVDPRNPPAWYTPTGNGDQSADCHGSTPSPGSTSQPMTVDGVRIPVTGDKQIRIPQTWHSAGAHERYRIIDASANGYLHVKQFEVVNGARQQKNLVVVARDGVDVGKNRLAVNRRSVLVPPGGRLDIDVARSSNDQIIVADGDFCAGNNGDATPSRDVLVIHPTKSGARLTAVAAPAPRLADAAHLTAADAFVKSLAPEAQRPHRVLTFQQYWDGFYVTETSGDDPFHLTANAFIEEPFTLAPPAAGSHDTYVMPTIHVHRPKRTPSSPPYVEHWTLVNAATQIHAFHIHQLTFVTLNNPFEPLQTKVFEDTTPLLPGTPCIMQSDGKTCVKRTDNTYTPWVLPTKTEIEIDFTKVPLGRWVFHCHMLDHEDKGMMGIIQVDGGEPV